LEGEAKKYFSTIYQTISRGYVKHFVRSFAFIIVFKHALELLRFVVSRSPHRSQIDREMSVRREYVSQIKIIFELSNWTTILLEIMTAALESRDSSEEEADEWSLTDINRLSEHFNHLLSSSLPNHSIALWNALTTCELSSNKQPDFVNYHLGNLHRAIIKATDIWLVT
jgi:hypothetical protein